MLFVNGSRSSSLAMRIGHTHGLSALIVLRRANGTVISGENASALLAVLEASNVRMPHDPYDPTEKFARYNFPSNIDKDQAMELVRAVPTTSEKLPIGQ